MIAWYIRHGPTSAHAMLGEAVGQAEQELRIPRNATVDTLHTAVSMDGDLTNDEQEAFQDFFDQLLPDQSCWVRLFQSDS